MKHGKTDEHNYSKGSHAIFSFRNLLTLQVVLQQLQITFPQSENSLKAPESTLEHISSGSDPVRSLLYILTVPLRNKH